MKKKLAFILLTTIASTSFALTEEVKNEIINEIDKHKPEITKEYLQNYALNEADKQKNISLLAKKYISKKKISDKDYIQEFTYEAEKQGFVDFLKGRNKECSKIEEGPLYKTDVAAYEVKCINSSNNNYYMTFDYKTNTWNLLDTLK